MLKLDLIFQNINQNEIPLPDRYQQEKNEKVIGLMKDELAGKIIRKFVGLKAKTYNYLIDDSSKNKKAKSTKKYVIKKNSLNLNIIKTVQKQLILRMKKVAQKKIKLTQIVLKKS